MLEKQILLFNLIFFAAKFVCKEIARSATANIRKAVYRTKRKLSSSTILKDQESKERNIVIIGASFAGYFAAHFITSSLPPDSPYRVIVIEPHSHFNFTWVFPRFCVVEGHEHKAFIPYGFYLPVGSVRWVQDRVAAIERGCVLLRNSKEKIDYEFLIIATGSGTPADGLQGLPSRVAVDDKAEGMELLRSMQQRIKVAKKVVVVGGGAAGVELAADAKQLYPDKEIVLIHSREALMHRFGPELQAAALAGLKSLRVEVILGERVVVEHKGTAEGFVTLSSGKKVSCDFMINCAGQKPASQILVQLSPSTITQSGHISVKPTLQITDETLPNIYACGDVANTGVRNPNARAAMQQARCAADNIVLAAQGNHPRHNYVPHWSEAFIKLTLGLDKAVSNFGDGKTELNFRTKEKDLALMAGGAWKHLGVKPFEDDLAAPRSPQDIESAVGKSAS